MATKREAQLQARRLREDLKARGKSRTTSVNVVRVDRDNPRNWGVVLSPKGKKPQQTKYPNPHGRP